MNKYLFIISSLSIGGIETYLLRFISYIKDNNDIEIHVLCKSGNLGSLARDYSRLGVKLIPLHIGYFNISSWLALNKILKKTKYDAVCDFTGNFAGIPLWLAWQAKCPTRISFYRHSQEFFKPTVGRRLYCYVVNRMTKKFATQILSNSQAAFDNFFHKSEWEDNFSFRVIPNGIWWNHKNCSAVQKKQLKAELGIPSDHKIVGHVSRYLPQKNHSAIINVANLFQEKKRKVTFLLVGRGVKEHYETQVKHYRLKNVIFTGERRDVLNLLTIMDAFYFPSKSEGQPNALLEAVASHVPFVASDLPEIRACFPEWWGRKWLVDPDDSLSAANILDLHLYRKNVDNNNFDKLVSWLRVNNSQEIRFQEFWTYLA